MSGGQEPSDAPTLSALLAAFMAERGLRLRQLADRAGVSAATLSRWLHATPQRPYQRAALLKIATALELNRVQTNRLLCAAGLTSLDAVAASADPEERVLLARWSARPRNNLPSALTSFVGRGEEVAELADMLCRPDVRLVTLTGPGGSGKTRLALRVAEEALDSFSDGVFLVPLAAVSDPALVILSIAETIGLRDVPDAALAARLSGWLAARGRGVLLLLDNLEQIGDCGPAICELLREAPGLKVLATSRVPLHLSGEHVWQVAPFPLPRLGEPRRTQRANPAVALFVQRARAANPRRTLQDDDDLKAIVEICTRLDGLPLAIELAAAGTREREPWRLLADFPSRLDLGSDGPRDVATRQRTLRATIAWSVDLLPEPARVLFARLSVFAGGWSEAASCPVCLPDACVPDQVARLLAMLVDASLIERVPTPSSLNGTRYRMLETIREYAQERLTEAGEVATLRERHARYFLELAESGPPYVPDVRKRGWHARIEADIDNLRAALKWASDAGDFELLVRLVDALWPYWWEHQRLAEGRHWLLPLLARRGELPPQRRASLLIGAGKLVSGIADFDEMASSAEEALGIYRKLGDPRGQALAHGLLGWANLMQCRVEQVIAAFEAELEQWRLTGDELGITTGISELAMASTIYGDFGAATRYLLEEEARCQEIQDAQMTARSLRNRGLLALLTGNFTTAISPLSEACDVFRAAGSYMLGGAIFYLGTAQCFAGQLENAVASYTESLRIYEAIGDQVHLALTLLGFAAVARRQCDGERAARLCGASHAIRQASQIQLPPTVEVLYQREANTVRDLIGEAAFNVAFAHGTDLTLAEALAYAREVVPPSSESAS